MSGHIILVQSNAIPGREQEFNDWYTNVHLDDVLELPGFVAAQRFEYSHISLHRGQPAPEAQFKFIAVYEVDADPVAAANALSDARATMYISPALAEEKVSLLYSPITERRTAGERSAAR